MTATEKRPGVLAHIVKLLNDASEQTPISKDDIVASLAAEFPDRDPVKMRATVQMQVPSGLLTERKLTVASKILEGTRKGYWIPKPTPAKKPARKRDRKAERARREAKLVAQQAAQRAMMDAVIRGSDLETSK